MRTFDLNQTKNDNSDSFKKKNKRKERLDDFGNPLDNGIYYNAKHGYRVRVYCEEHKTQFDSSTKKCNRFTIFYALYRTFCVL